MEIIFKDEVEGHDFEPTLLPGEEPIRTPKR